MIEYRPRDEVDAIWNAYEAAAVAKIRQARQQRDAGERNAVKAAKDGAPAFAVRLMLWTVRKMDALAERRTKRLLEQ